MLCLPLSSRPLVALPFTLFASSVLLLIATLGFAQSTSGIVPYSSCTQHQYDTISNADSNADLDMTVVAPVRSKGGPIPFHVCRTALAAESE